MKSSEELLELLPQDTEVIQTSGSVAAIVTSEVTAQLDAAHKWPRQVRKFISDAISMATMDMEVAMSCIYTLPRGKNSDGSPKVISGPSIRLAEICASAYGNLHIATRVVDVEERHIGAQGLVWDLEKNIKWAVEVRRRITDSKGRRYNDDMVVVAGNAAASIAARNAIFRAIPRAYVNAIYQRAREVAVGSAQTLSARRDLVIERLSKLGITKDRILGRISRHSAEEVTLDDLEVLIGLGTAIKSGDQTIEDAFPANVEPVKGTLDVSQFKPGKTENRGHGQERMEGIKPAPASALENQLTDSLADRLLCDVQDFMDIETMATDAKVRMKDVAAHVIGTMGFAEYGKLTKARKNEVVAWIAALGKAAKP